MRLPCEHEESSLCLQTSSSQTVPFLQLPWEQNCANSPVFVVSRTGVPFAWLVFSSPFLLFI